MFGAELIDFCNNNNFCFIDKEKLSPDSLTFVSQAHGTTSWLDHCITTTSSQSITSNNISGKTKISLCATSCRNRAINSHFRFS